MRDKGSSYHGKGVSNAVNNVNNIIAPALVGKVSYETLFNSYMVKNKDKSTIVARLLGMLINITQE